MASSRVRRGSSPGRGVVSVADLSRGEVAVVLTGAAAAGGGFPPSVADTPANRALWEEISAQVKAMPEGTIVDIPPDWAGGD